MFDIFVVSANAIPSQQNLDSTVWQLVCFRSQRFGFATVTTRKRWDRSFPPHNKQKMLGVVLAVFVQPFGANGFPQRGRIADATLPGNKDVLVLTCCL